MNFDFDEDQKLLQRNVHDFLSGESGLEVSRRVLEDGATHDAGLWKGVAEMGLLGTAVPEAFGGSGLGHLELSLVAEEMGRALSPVPFSSSAYLAIEALMLAGDDAQRQRYLPRLCSGEAIGTLAVTEGPGYFGAREFHTTLDGDRVTGKKLAVPDGRSADLAVVAATGDDGLELLLVDLHQDGVVRGDARSFDPARPVANLEFKGVNGELLGDGNDHGAKFRKVLDRAAVLMAFEQLGGAARAFELTREYTMDRFVFGRSVASFQAIKHRLADLFCDIELSRSHAYYGAWAMSTDADELGVAACAARASASDAFDLAATEMVHMHGGVGFTWEADCHLFYRRARHLALCLGGAHEWRDRLVRRLEEAA